MLHKNAFFLSLLLLLALARLRSYGFVRSLASTLRSFIWLWSHSFMHSHLHAHSFYSFSLAVAFYNKHTHRACTHHTAMTTTTTTTPVVAASTTCPTYYAKAVPTTTKIRVTASTPGSRCSISHHHHITVHRVLRVDMHVQCACVRYTHSMESYRAWTHFKCGAIKMESNQKKKKKVCNEKTRRTKGKRGHSSH